MRTSRFIAGLLLLGAARAGAQKADSTGRPTASLPVGATAGSVAPDAPNDSGGPTLRCWLGCRHSLQRTTPAEWSRSAQANIDTLESRLGRRHPTVAPAAAHASAAAPGAKGGQAATAASTTEPGAAPALAGESGYSRSSVDADRYLIEEWRQSELNIADSLHHAVLVRISRLFDSAQRAGVSPDDRLRIEQQVDGINSVNQMMWIQRRVEVWRQADSALHTLVGPP